MNPTTLNGCRFLSQYAYLACLGFNEPDNPHRVSVSTGVVALIAYL